MAQITLTIENSQVQKYLDAFGYKDTINGQPNPESPTNFVKRKLREFAQAKVKAYQIQKAIKAIVVDVPDIT